MVTSSGNDMTIGVAAAGAQAGAAVFDAVLGAELLGRGAIGGFVVFAVLDEQGRLQYRTTQRGGVTALDLPASWRDARVAAVISSGPDRPEPDAIPGRRRRPGPGHRPPPAESAGRRWSPAEPDGAGPDGRGRAAATGDRRRAGRASRMGRGPDRAARARRLGLGNNARARRDDLARSSARDSRAAWRCCTTPSTRAACWPMSWADWPGPG